MLTKMVGRPKGGKNNSGGIAAPRKSNGNIDWDKILFNYLRPILDSQIAPNTSRGLMYILKSMDILKKSDYIMDLPTISLIGEYQGKLDGMKLQMEAEEASLMTSPITKLL